MVNTHEDKELDSRVYEVGFHLVPSLSDSDLALRVDEIRKAIEEKGGVIISEDYPQILDLAYTMRRMSAGSWHKYDTAYFGWIKFEGLPEAALALKQMLEHSDFVVRYLLIKTVRENTMQGRRPVTKRDSILATDGDGEEAAPAKVAEGGEINEEEIDKSIAELVS